MRRCFPTWKILVDRFAVLELGGVTGRNIEALSIQAVSDADPDWIYPVKPIEIRYSKLVDTIDHRRITRRYRVEPAATARPARGRTKLPPHLMKHFGQGGIFRGQRPLAHPCRVSLHYSEN